MLPRTKQLIQDAQLAFGSLSPHDYRVIWIRSPDYSQQLYISPSYQTVWERAPQTLYDHPESWMETLLGDNNQLYASLLTVTGPKGEPRSNDKNYGLYRIHCGDQQKWIKDNHYYLFDRVSHEVIAVAGLSEAVSQTQWQLELTENCSFEDNQMLQFQHHFVQILEKELKVIARPTSHIPLLDDDYQKSSKIITHDNQTIRLSPRELDCLHRLAKGMSKKEIARELCISDRTVETHIIHMREKTNTKNTINLVGVVKGVL